MYYLILSRFPFFSCLSLVRLRTVLPCFLQMLEVENTLLLWVVPFQSYLFPLIPGIPQSYSPPPPAQALGNIGASVSLVVLPSTQWSIKTVTCTFSSPNPLTVSVIFILTGSCKDNPPFLTCLKQNSTYSTTEWTCGSHQDYWILYINIWSNRM